MSTIKKAALVALATGLGMGALAACSGSGSASSGSDSRTVTLVSHDSFAASASVLKEFEKTSGYRLKVLKDGDAGEAVNKAILTKDNPQGDVFFGVDNTLLSRALDNHLFEPYRAAGLDRVRPEALPGKDHAVTPIDTGEICVNYDKAYFASHHQKPPATFADLADPAYRNLLVTENASTSSPGLGFLLGSAARYGDKGWPAYWTKLKNNGVKVVDTWEQAYNEEFSGSAGGRKAGGDRPLVVSYASSPPAEAIYAQPQPKTAPTGVATGTCFRQTEYAGLLAHARNPKGGKALIDFLISTGFQDDMPLNMFVDPVNEKAQPPAEYRKYAVRVATPQTMPPDDIARHRDQWVRTWTSLVLK